ncbi:radical SAM mobile pair protein B [Lactococcus hodotermopsidis]|uniref:Radical SAM mobile pair protein B n=1 Tax=Pseudolactococcus hodotermopsidis TaxID=2709157 RepID=A0A6A0BFM7_9LACT|nr:radical SAM protein [Lactococcus hodotermopsidis]GFH43081.1 radical SAM mobile pair protein B [Lactococcus hodotermopsidis]
MARINKYISTKSLIVKSNLPEADYVINPYVGCLHNCVYCYASFMKRFYKIDDDWGKFAIPKTYSPIKNIQKYDGKTVLFSSVTDPYQPIERKYQLTRKILSDFRNSSAKLEILTKSPLVLRDLDILKTIPYVTVGMSFSLTIQQARRVFEVGCVDYQIRLDTIKEIKRSGIRTYAFISPIFPEISDVKKIVNDVCDYVDYIFFENLNLKGIYKKNILSLIREYYPDYIELYEKIYSDSNYASTYWKEQEKNIVNYLQEKNIVNYKFFFNHGRQ